MKTVARITSDKKLELYDEIIEYPTELEGGRNLILNSYSLEMTGSDNGNRNVNTFEEGVHIITPTNNGNVYNTQVQPSIELVKGHEYTLSFDVLTNTAIGVYWYADTGVGSYSGWGIPNTGGKWIKHEYTYTQTRDSFKHTFLWGLHNLIAGSEVRYKNLKLEKGNKATDWTPAPEDLGYDFPPEIASFKPGISSGGVLLTPEIIEYPSELEGGRNLLENSINLSRSWETDAYPTYLYLLRINIVSILPKVKVGDELTFSMDIWAESATTLRVYDSNGNPSISFGSHNLSVPEGESRQSFTTKLTSHSRENTEWIMDVYNNNNGVKFSFSNVKIEKGNVATDWTPAPEDLGMDYPNDIQHFSTGFRSSGKVLVRELEEGVDL